MAYEFKVRCRYRVKISWVKLYGNWYLGAYLHQLMQSLQIHVMVGHRLLTVFLHKKPSVYRAVTHKGGTSPEPETGTPDL